MWVSNGSETSEEHCVCGLGFRVAPRGSMSPKNVLWWCEPKRVGIVGNIIL